MHYENLSQLWADIYRRGESVVASGLVGQEDEAQTLLASGLVSTFRVASAGSEPMSLGFDVTLRNGEKRRLLLEYRGDGEAPTVVPWTDQSPRSWLATDSDRILYIIAGTQNDTARYRAKILAWWKQGHIVAGGCLMTLQRWQGMFRG